jgi:hypothetical protein
MIRHLAATLLCVGFIHGCAAQNASVKPAATPDGLMTLYNHAVHDASVFTAAHILPLRTPAPGTVAVVTFTPLKDVDPLGPRTTGAEPVWVTLVPEVQDLCRAWHTTDLILRLEQLIGLPPGSGDTMMETFTIDSTTLQRPCPDPDPMLPQCGNTPAKDLSPAYLSFFVGQTLGAYQVPGGYPWTHLGYTYDWNPASTNHYGASEYIVPPGSAIVVTAVQTAADYCRPAAPQASR